MSAIAMADYAFPTFQIPDILETGGPECGFRYRIAPIPGQEFDKPFFAFYPFNDIGFLKSPEWAKLPTTSKYLPGGTPYINAAFDVRNYEQIKDEGPKEEKGKSILFIEVYIYIYMCVCVCVC